MLQVLLVDDEPLELKALRDHVDWESLGVGNVMTAKNGKVAYELVLEREPEIVITDVHMPVMDGITLAEKIHVLDQKIKVVFLSGYDDFSYVKAAMHMGAVDYLLKPFTSREIEDVIRRVKEALNRDQLFFNSLEVLEQQLLGRLCMENETDEKILLQELARIQQVGAGKETYGLLLFFGVSSKSLVNNLLKNAVGIRAAWLDGGKLGVLLKSYENPVEEGRKIQEILYKLTGVWFSGVYLDRCCLQEEELRDSYQLLKTWETFVYYQESAYFDGVGKEDDRLPSDLLQGQMPESVMEEEVSRLERLFPYEDEEAVKTELDRFFGMAEERMLPKGELEGSLWRVLLLLEKRLSMEICGIQKFRISRKEMENCQCVGELGKLLLLMFRRVSMENGERDNGKTAFVVRKVKEYVQQHFGEPMTVEAMAEEIHLSVNYVRTIFKEGTGQTILEYMTDYRFEKACEFLKDPTLKIREVGNRVGYENISYFCSIFTKRYRMTPNEYRKKFL